MESPSSNQDSVQINLDVSILIVSHGHDQWLPSCIGSLAAALEGVIGEVLLLDNLGGDLKPLVPSLSVPIHVFSNKRPQGFAENVNFLVSQCHGRDIVVLNPDTKFLSGKIGDACNYLHNHLEVGLLGSRLLNRDGSVQPNCRPFPTLLYFLIRGMGLESKFPNYSRTMSMDTIQFEDITPVDWVFGALLIFRRDEFQKLGGMDQGFPLYYEDVDLAMRYRKLGKSTVYFPKLVFYHSHLRTSAKLPFSRVWWFHIYSAMRFFIKHQYMWKLRLPEVKSFSEG